MRKNDIVSIIKRNRGVLTVAAFIALIVYVLGDGAHFICTALGIGLVLGGYRIIKRLGNHPEEATKHLVTGTAVLTAVIVIAINAGNGAGGLSDIVTGVGGGGLMLVMYLLFKHYGPEEFRGSK
ncbi:hypothetical protein GCM10010402_68220 [Actinomadura luteofluorescens]|uniref:hypothetical protein n=1 Tax=Actinomadura luteofluorescens TaxID=46163 RepID=UPI002164B5D7|nr:hypothetical protein [Actinomadura glauciflava]MCR3740060.1 hypothetical protein [Actinomadura glauciflava]